MSPRSEEFLGEARRCLNAAAALLKQGLASRSIHESYYAMLYAARGALSERDESAKTHRGVWHLFREAFVDPGPFDPRLYEVAQKAQGMREAADYDAAGFSDEEAEGLYRDAVALVDGVEAMFDE